MSWKQVDPSIVDVSDVIFLVRPLPFPYQGLFEGADYVPQPSNSGQGFGANVRWIVTLSFPNNPRLRCSVTV